MTTDSQRQERRLASVYGGTINPGSGNTDGHKNDVRTPQLSIEAKCTRGKSYSMKLHDLITAEKEAIRDGRNMLFAIDFIQPGQTRRYVVWTEDDYLENIEQWKRVMGNLMEMGDKLGELEYRLRELDK